MNSKSPPIVIVSFKDNICTWQSPGWGDDFVLLGRAQQAIDDGENPQDVICLLRAAGFDVTDITEYRR